MRVLIIDDERSVADTLVMILQREGHQAVSAYSGAAALQKVESFFPDCVISDVIMPGMNGIELCSILEQKCPDCNILLFSGQASTNELVEKARSQGHTWELLAKPVDPDELLEKLSSLQAKLLRTSPRQQ
jgi:CheY-like chemotaxis protein